VQIEPADISADDIQDMVRREELPDWVGQALTNASDGSAAIAPAHEDAGEVVTSREKPLPCDPPTDEESAAGLPGLSVTLGSRLPRLVSDARGGSDESVMVGPANDSAGSNQGQDGAGPDARTRTSVQPSNLAHVRTIALCMTSCRS
jgi:hypothetical protein